jgi:hypothetical protein
MMKFDSGLYDAPHTAIHQSIIPLFSLDIHPPLLYIGAVTSIASSANAVPQDQALDKSPEQSRANHDASYRHESKGKRRV